MTNELTQSMIDGISKTSHVKQGFGGFFITVGAILLVLVICYVIGVIIEYKKSKKILKPNARYFLIILKGLKIAVKSLFGIAPPASIPIRSDAYYYQPTQDEFDEALLMVHQMMVNGGWTIENYSKRSKDCEDYAMKMAVELRNYIATTFPEKVGARGVAIGNIAYKRDVDGVGHVIVKAFINGRVKYFEPYPGIKYLKEKPMSLNELDSIFMDIM